MVVNFFALTKDEARRRRRTSDVLFTKRVFISFSMHNRGKRYWVSICQGVSGSARSRLTVAVVASDRQPEPGEDEDEDPI